MSGLSIGDLQQHAMTIALRGFSEWVEAAADKWDADGIPHPNDRYVASVMALQYLNHLLGRDIDADWPDTVSDPLPPCGHTHDPLAVHQALAATRGEYVVTNREGEHIADLLRKGAES